MAKTYVLFNPIAGGGQYQESLDKLKTFIEGDLELCDMTYPDTYEKTIPAMSEDDSIVICGGDGTLNRFANKIYDLGIKNEILYFPCGSGNDFAREFGFGRYEKPFPINKYLESLPSVTVNGETYRFINGVGYGIDGYCCEVGDKLRATSTKPVNYTSIAIKGLLFHYKPKNAKITVDGKTYEYKKVWIAPTMKGRFYGGGMMPTPAQDRNAEDGRLSVMVFHGSSALKTLMVFPSLFKGEHVKHTKYVTVIEGYDISVEYDAPAPVQIDGETISGVTSYRATSAVTAPVECSLDA